jgi:hypothetical protein
MLKDENLAGFWRSRLERGDPWGRTGASIWDRGNPSLSERDLAMGEMTTTRLLGALAARDGLAMPASALGARGMAMQYRNELTKIGLGVARGHVGIVGSLGGYTAGLEASALMHHQVFANHGLPATTYGGTPVFAL